MAEVWLDERIAMGAVSRAGKPRFGGNRSWLRSNLVARRTDETENTLDASEAGEYRFDACCPAAGATASA
jgi:hypothetical protein